MMGPIRVCLYSPADLNIVSGASIWVQSVAETLHAGPDVHVILPLRMVERRPLITGQLRRMSRVELVDPRRLRPFVPATGLDLGDALDLIEAIDAEAPFDAIILRSFSACLAAIERPGLRGRLWSTYVLEPEQDMGSAAYLSDLARIAGASRHVVVQSEEMRALLEALVPAARGRTIIMPPAVPTAGTDGTPNGVPRPAPRLWYAGKFHPFYPVPVMIDLFEKLRVDHPTLEFHAIGDQMFRPPGGDAWADQLERRLVTTPGLTWHGAVTRADAIRLMSGGGIALSLWDYRHGDRMNDLVVSTKLLDYCLAGLPVVLNRTAAQESILGRDYPLFVADATDALSVVRRVLDDPVLAIDAAERCRAAIARFAYPVVHAGIAPFLERRPTARLYLADRPKLEGAERNVGLLLAATVKDLPAAVAALAPNLAAIEGVRLVVGRLAGPGAPEPPVGADPTVELLAGLDPEVRRRVGARTVVDTANWWRTIGIALIAPGVDAEAVEEAAASGAVVVQIADADLPASPDGALNRIRVLLDPVAWADASRAARASAFAKASDCKD